MRLLWDNKSGVTKRWTVSVYAYAALRIVRATLAADLVHCTGKIPGGRDDGANP